MAAMEQSPGGVMDTNVETITSFIMRELKDRELAVFMNAMQLSFKFIVRAVRKAGIHDLYGLANTTNSSGDDVKKLDLLSDEIMIDALLKSGTCALLVSEEQEEPIIVPEHLRGTLCCAFDPLDGSSNIDCNVSTGTIFSVFKKTSEGEPTTADILKAGTEMIAAGYCMYGSAVDLVITFMNGVHRFTLDDSIGEFVYMGPVKFPANPKKIYSCNEGNYQLWDEKIQQAVEKFKNPTEEGAKPYSARYVGSMVSDVHRTILYGGIFMYPADKKSTKGKLRLLYEGLPMASIIEQAGGVASCGFFNGKVRRILDVVPEFIHDRCPIVMGSERDTSKVLSLYE
jgi:fructose-1,6-bisphosphatase I